ncbi:aminopeptidase N-like isoform X1 [Myzus persicae]|uniref:aminopeptidase N-like isoform X1 n=2 Tax=Myzus persicae TaxID=13164 RepID=UPI000B936A0E|nr:aminopeptidase N-like isoform X1 [Myzus persicae]XP_022181226.1 aminopeptidase N-like isoform X1 [Myzus persicae]XP_022181227.1 aminopeptidase N-like isoform X1 [Myzus persicae]
MKYKFNVHEAADEPMDGDATYATRRKSLRVSWTLLTSSFAFIVLLCALCLFFFFHPRTCGQSSGGPRFGSTEKILDEIRGFDYERMENDYGATDVRLPTEVVPESYDLRIIPFLWAGNSTFDGQVDIVVNATAPVDGVTLHAVDLNMTECLVTRYPKMVLNEHVMAESVFVPILETQQDLSKQFFIIKFKDVQPADYQYNIHIKYTGKLQDNMEGFYKSSYNVGNKTRWIAATQFQPTDARKAFPCFDEPALKAKFTVSIARPEDMSSISNTGLKYVDSKLPTLSEPLSSYEWDTFEQTVPMSTYLVAFIISDFEYLSSETFRVWARSDVLSHTHYARDIGPSILKFYEEFFSIPYPLKKTDLVALPDFAAGAMENWGLVTFREIAMLYNEGVSPNGQKERVATVIAHELAHQWFGNLVTPDWWSDLWLNEGFATYIEYVGVDHVEPKWKMEEQFISSGIQSVFLMDSLKSTHPISARVSRPEEINELFDRISYDKGASVIRMMDHFLTRQVFRKGLTKYLKAKAYKSAYHNDLWDALTEQAQTDRVMDNTLTVKDVMDTWILQPGFPVVNVTRNYEVDTLIISQSRFLLHDTKNAYKADQLNNLWWIPLTFTTSSKLDFSVTKPSYWFKPEESMTITETGIPSNNWVLFNINETGFYRVNYDSKNWNMLIEYLTDPEMYSNIGTINRAQLIDDAMSLSRAGYLSYQTSLDLTKYLYHETEYVPWKSAYRSFTYLHQMLIKTSIYDKLKAYVLHLISPMYKITGFADNPRDDQLVIYKRSNLLSCACELGHTDCVRNAVAQFQNWKSNPQPEKNNPISPNLKAIIYCTAISYGSEEEWDFAWKMYKMTTVASEKDLLLDALGCSRETWILARFLSYALQNNSSIRNQDISKVFYALTNKVAGQEVAWNYVRDNWRNLKSTFAAGFSTMSEIIKSATYHFNTKNDLIQLWQFYKDEYDHLGSARRSVLQSIENAEANVNWMERNFKTISNWLQNTTLYLSQFTNEVD